MSDASHSRRRGALIAWAASLPLAALHVLAAASTGALGGVFVLTTQVSGDYAGILLGSLLMLTPFVALALLVSFVLGGGLWLFAAARLRNLAADEDPTLPADPWTGRVRATGPVTLALSAGLAVLAFLVVIVA